MKTTAVRDEAPTKLFAATSFCRCRVPHFCQALQSQHSPLLNLSPSAEGAPFSSWPRGSEFLLLQPCTAAQKTQMTQHNKVLQGLEYSSIYRLLNLTEKKISKELQSNCYLDVSRPSQSVLAHCHVFKSYPAH